MIITAKENDINDILQLFR